MAKEYLRLLIIQKGLNGSHASLIAKKYVNDAISHVDELLGPLEEDYEALAA